MVRNPMPKHGLGSSPFARRYSGNRISFSSSGYLDVSVPRVPHMKLWIHFMFHGSSPWEFPHSEICGSMLICSSPQLIAACHVLHRLLMPRHPLYALLHLNFCRISSRIFSVLSSLELLCITFYSYLFRVSKIVFYLALFGKT